MLEQWQLHQRQSLPYEVKVELSKKKIREFADDPRINRKVYVSFSGGRDSTVLLHLVRSVLGDRVPAVFDNTGVEYPELVRFARATPNMIELHPDVSFMRIIKERGYPLPSKKVAEMIWRLRHPTDKNAATTHLYLTGERRDGTISKRWLLPAKWRFLLDSSFSCTNYCCDALKKKPLHEYQKATGNYPYVGTMACESETRRSTYMTVGCNAFSASRGAFSQPIAVWLESDVAEYIKRNSIELASVYDNPRITQTGCMWCLFGIGVNGKNHRFFTLRETHPQLYQYALDKLGYRDVLNHCAEYMPNLRGWEAADA